MSANKDELDEIQDFVNNNPLIQSNMAFCTGPMNSDLSDSKGKAYAYKVNPDLYAPGAHLKPNKARLEQMEYNRIL